MPTSLQARLTLHSPLTPTFLQRSLSCWGPCNTIFSLFQYLISLLSSFFSLIFCSASCHSLPTTFQYEGYFGSCISVSSGLWASHRSGMVQVTIMVSFMHMLTAFLSTGALRSATPTRVDPPTSAMTISKRASAGLILLLARSPNTVASLSLASPAVMASVPALASVV